MPPRASALADDDIEILCARVDTIVDRCEDERNYDREINDRREKWENYLKYDHLGEDNPLQTLTHMRIRKYIEMFVEDLENPEAPTKSLFEKRMHRLWCLSIGIGSFLMEDTVSVSEDRESEITILREGIRREPSCLEYRRSSPGSYSTGNNRNRIHNIIGSTIEILIRDIFDGLQSGQEIIAIPDLHISRYSSDRRIRKVSNQFCDRLSVEECICIDYDDNISLRMRDRSIDRISLSTIREGKTSDICMISGYLLCIEKCLIRRTIIDNDHFQMRIITF